jgi:hypothetical protein
MAADENSNGSSGQQQMTAAFAFDGRGATKAAVVNGGGWGW